MKVFVVHSVIRLKSSALNYWFPFSLGFFFFLSKLQLGFSNAATRFGLHTIRNFYWWHSWWCWLLVWEIIKASFSHYILTGLLISVLSVGPQEMYFSGSRGMQRRVWTSLHSTGSSCLSQTIRNQGIMDSLRVTWRDLGLMRAAWFTRHWKMLQTGRSKSGKYEYDTWIISLYNVGDYLVIGWLEE